MKAFLTNSKDDFFHSSSPCKEIDKQIEWDQLSSVMMTVQLVHHIMQQKYHYITHCKLYYLF
jgi:hypothetical protein